MSLPFVPKRQGRPQSKTQARRQDTRAKWTGGLQRTRKGDWRKVRIAKRLRAETMTTLKWIADQLLMGTWTHVAKWIYHVRVSIPGTDPGTEPFWKARKPERDFYRR